jgi:PAS domain S-box-containing protein
LNSGFTDTVLILSPVGEEGPATATQLQTKGIPTHICFDPADCVGRMAARAGALILAEESLELPQISLLRETLRSQPHWSELPLIILTRRGQGNVGKSLEETVLAAGSATLLERPVSASVLFHAVHAALRSRQRQFHVREVLHERDQERAALQQIEECSGLLFDKNPDGVFAVSPAGRFILVNAACEEICGYPRAELLGKDFQDLWAPEARETLSRIFEQQLVGPHYIEYETTLIRRNGARVEVWVGGKPLMKNGKIMAIHCTAKDITRRKQAEQTLRATSARLAAVLEAQRDISGMNLESKAFLEFILDRTSRLAGGDGACLEIVAGDELVYEAASGIAAGFVGLRLRKAGSLSGSSMDGNEILRTDDTESDPRVDREACRRIGLRSMIVLPLRYDQRSFGVLKVMSSRPAAFDEGAEQMMRLMSEFLGVMVARHRAGKALRASELRYRRLYDSIRDACVVVDMNGRIQDCNRAYEEMLGYTRDELLSLTYVEVTPEKWHAFEAKLVTEEIVPHGSSDVYEKEYRRKDGTIFPVELRTFLIRDDSDQPRQMCAIVRDVTERKRAEEALAATHRQMQSIIDNTPALIYAFDLEARFVMVNQALADLWKTTPRQMLGRKRHEFMPRGDAEWHEANDRKVVEAGRALEFEEYSQITDGTITWLTAKFPLRDAQGQICAVAGVSTNISERKRAEEALRESEGRFRTLADNMNQLVWMADQTGWRFWYNKRWFDYTGKSLEEMEGWGWRSVHHPDHLQRAVDRIARCVETGETCEDTFPLRGEDGHYRWFLLRAMPIRDAHGKVVRWFGTNTDITELRQAQQALVENEQRLRLAKTAAQLGVHEYRPISGELIWDDRMRELWGIGPDETVNYDVFLARLHPEDRDPTQAAVDRALDPNGRGQYRAEFRIIHPQRTIWVAATGQVTFENGLPIRLVGTVQDITERKEFQAQLERLVAERTANLKELVAELEHFSYSITHDMRAPLRAMQGFAEIFAEACAEGLPPNAQRFLERIRTAANRMDALIVDALSYSEAIRKHLPLGPVDPGLLLHGMLDTYPELQGPRVHIEVQPNLPLVFANEAGLTQVFSNLLNNAIKFAKPEGPAQIRVWAELTQRRPEPPADPRTGPPGVPATGFAPMRSLPNPGAKPDSQWVRIWVEDQGIGIPETMLPRVFNMFARGDNQQSGTGIGLALVRKVVDRMGGRVGVESREGQGSRFWFELSPAA